MILDSFKLETVVTQLRYVNAFELWDKAGAISRQLSAIWSDLRLVEVKPQQQILRGNGVDIQTGLTQSTVTLSGSKSLEQGKVQQMKETFEVWRDMLSLGSVKRISTRATYSKEFPTMKEANSALFALNLARWPTTKVFDQPETTERNGIEMLYRFEDENSFSLLQLKAEQLKFEVDLDPEWVDGPEIRKKKSRMVIDFDRGLLGTVNAEKFRMDDWIKGFQHVLRRDIEKVIKAES